MRFALPRPILALLALWRQSRRPPPAPAARPNPYALPARVAVALLAAQRARR